MERVLFEQNLSDDDEEEVLRSIALQRSLISKSQALTGGLSRGLPPASSQQNSLTQVDTSIGVEEDKNPYCDALRANLEYDRYLAKLETSLKTLIAKCKTTLTNLARDRRPGAVAQFFGRGSYAFCFGAPFFKDEQFYPCPPNADTVTKRQQGELCLIDLPPVRWWMPSQTKALLEDIKKQSRQACQQDAFREKNALVRRCKALEDNSEERKRLEEEIKNFSIDSYVSTHIDEKIASTDHDWLRLSASVLDGKKSSDECRAFWYNYLHPKYSKEKWTKDEDSKLRSLAKDNK